MKKLIYVLLASAMVLTACSGSKKEIQMGTADYAAHGTKAMAVAHVAISGEEIIAAFIDEYQFMDAKTATGVPNSTDKFGANFKEGYVLASKRVNKDSYSATMASKGQATQTIDTNFNAIQEFVKGKKISDIKAVIEKTDDEIKDAVTGSTLEDTKGYLSAIVKAAEEAQKGVKVSYSGDVKKLVLNQVDNAPHGTNSFAITTVLTDGKAIVAAAYDEYQVMDKTKATGVANSDTDFGTYVKEGFVLASKRVNNEYYSSIMKEKGQATQTYVTSYEAIIAFAVTQKPEELKTLLEKDGPEVTDAVTGSTLEDTKGYLEGILKAVTETK